MTIDPHIKRALDKFDRKLRELDARSKANARKPQLPNSSIDTGSLNVRGGKIRTWLTNTEGEEYVSTSLGGSDPQSFEIFNDPDAGATFSVTPAGDMSAHGVSVASDPLVMGVPVLGSLVNPGTAGWMDQMPRGVLPRADFTDVVEGVTVPDLPIGSGGSETIGYGIFMVTLQPNRTYRVDMPWRGYVQASTGEDQVHQTINLYVKYADDPTQLPDDPTTADVYVGSQGQRWPASTTSPGVGISDVFSTIITTGDPFDGQPIPAKFLLGMWSHGGTFAVDTDPTRVTMWRMSVADVGPANVWVPVKAPGATPVQRYTSTWAATDSRIYSLVSGNQRDVGVGRTQMWQGGYGDDASYSAFVCNGTAIDGETGLTMDQALTTAKTIETVEVGLQTEWAETTPCEALGVWLDQDTLPASFGTSGAPQDEPKHMQFQTGSQFRWFPVPSSQAGGFDQATTRGMVLGAYVSQLSASFHLHLTGSARTTPTADAPTARPMIRVTYTR